MKLNIIILIPSYIISTYTLYMFQYIPVYCNTYIDPATTRHIYIYNISLKREYSILLALASPLPLCTSSLLKRIYTVSFLCFCGRNFADGMLKFHFQPKTKIKAYILYTIYIRIHIGIMIHQQYIHPIIEIFIHSIPTLPIDNPLSISSSTLQRR